MNAATTKMAMSVLTWVLPIAAGYYVVTRTKHSIKNLFKVEDKTMPELVADNAIENNIDGIAIMSKDLKPDYSVSAIKYEVWRNQHANNPKILKVVFDPRRRLREKYIPYIDVAVIDSRLLKELGDWRT